MSLQCLIQIRTLQQGNGTAEGLNRGSSQVINLLQTTSLARAESSAANQPSAPKPPAIGETLRARSRVKLGIRVVVVVFILRVRGAIVLLLRLIDPPTSVGVHRFMSGVPALCRGLPFGGFAIFNRHLASLLIVL